LPPGTSRAKTKSRRKKSRSNLAQNIKGTPREIRGVFVYFSIMEIKFTPSQYEFLKANLLNEDEVLFNILEQSKTKDYHFNLSEEDICAISDWAGEKLQAIGFDKNYDVNEKGRYLEGIIDILYI
jgi:hypothetical protein